MTARFAEGLRPGLARRSVVAIGVFDALHRGHRAVCEALVAEAARHDAVPAVVTMDPPPAAVLRGTAIPRITPVPDRVRILGAWGVRLVVLVRPDRAFLSLAPAAFLDRLGRSLGVVGIVAAPGFRFGRDRAGSFADVRRAGCFVRTVRPVVLGGRPVSSTRVRAALAAGRLGEARRLLGRPLSYRLRPVPGAGRGRRLAVPTLNFPVPCEALAPGVYAGRVAGRPAALHLGPRPTFDDPTPVLEAHILGGGRVPRGEVAVEFVRRIRGVRRFATPAALRRRIRLDIARVRRIFAA